MIYLGSDHRGFEMKEKIKEWLTAEGREFEDMGPDHFDKDDDYPDFISKVGQKISENIESFGIILGATGQGEAIVANKYPGVRAIVYYGGPENIIELGRVHNDANVLSIGFAPGNTMAERKEMDSKEVIMHIKKFLDTKFLHEERHVRRIAKITKIEHER